MEGFPLRLVITALLISLTLPVVLSSLNAYETEIEERSADRMLNDLKNVIDEMVVTGKGNVRTFMMPGDIDSEQRMHLAGQSNDSDGIRLEVIGNDWRRVVFLEDNVLLVSVSGERLEVRPHQTIKLTNIGYDEGIQIMVEVI